MFISVKERMPLSSYEDDKFNGYWYEKEMTVIANGVETKATFWACWEEVKDVEEESEFLMGFDTDGVTHWKE